MIIIIIFLVFSKTKDMDGLFASFLSRCIQVIKKADFSKIVETYKCWASLRSGVPRHVEEKMLQARDFRTLFDALKPAHCNWSNFSVLNEVVQGADNIYGEGKELISEFTKTVFPKKINEIMWQIPQISTNTYSDVKETWNKDLHDFIVQDLFIHQEHLASILQIQQHSLVLQKIEPGIEIMELHWAIPDRLVYQARESATRKDIKKCRILILEIGGQKIEKSHQPVTEGMSG